MLDGLHLNSCALALDFTGTAFTAMVTKDGKPASYPEIADYPVLKYCFPEQYYGDSFPGLVTLRIRDGERLLSTRITNMITTADLECTLSPRAARITFKVLHEPFFDYVYDVPSASFHRKLPPHTAPLSDGYFIQGDTILKLPDEGLEEEVIPMLEQDLIQGGDIIMLAQAHTSLIRSRPFMAKPEERLMELQAMAKKGQQEVIITLKREPLPPEELQPLAGLDAYRMYRNTIYAIIPDAVVTELFADGDGLIVKKEDIPGFVNTHTEILRTFGDKKTLRLLSPDKIFIPRENLSLVLWVAPKVERGVGTAYAVPVVQYGKKRYTAQSISEQLESTGRPYVALDDKWVRTEILAALGIGELGCLIDGTPIRPMQLKAHEILNQGGDDLRGLWSGLEFENNPWVKAVDLDNGFHFHLNFLRTYGISGGIVAHHNVRSAELLAEYLAYLPTQMEHGTVILLMREKYHKEYLKKKLRYPLPVAQTGAGVSIFSPEFQGIGICYYEKLAQSMAGAKARYDMLILVKPEELLLNEQKNYYETIRAIDTRLRVGIIFNTTYLLKDATDAATNRLMEFFNLRGKMKKLVNHVFRDPDLSLALPQPYQFYYLNRRFPPVPFTVETMPPISHMDFPMKQENTVVFGGSRFVIRSPFSRPQGPDFEEEQQYFPKNGEQVPLIEFTISSDTDLRFSMLNKKRRDFFLYWRGEFRHGRMLEVPRNYIYIYALELIMVMGGGEPMDYFRELLRLWRSYRDKHPQLDYHLPRWLLDFAVLYQITDRAFPELLPYAQDCESNTVMQNIYLHKRYIEEDHPIRFADILGLLRFDPKKSGQDEEDSPVQGMSMEQEHRLEHPIEAALQGVDRYLRDHCGKKLFAFFYPSQAITYLFKGFPPMDHLGHAEYTGEWIDFYAHKPLREFFQRVSAYIEFRLNQEGASQKGAQEPRLEPLWKYLVDTELGFPGARLPAAPGLKTIELEQDTLDQLRHESDAVRELLRIETDEALMPEPVPLVAAEGPGDPVLGDQPPRSLGDFLAGLDAVATETLRLLLGVRTTQETPPETVSGALHKLAQRHGTMPELLFDTINEQFQERFNDLLIDTMDEDPVILAEYEKDVKKYFGIS
ncbi:MAG: TerB N-terminal domain-containing protein [Treponema sp.]|jgi:hypothetical protein|nr:TerB N-terminal domain-containing protein [Treponema sp.]